MQTDWATEHLQVIRTLMERSAVYRRALAPIMTTNGLLGTLAAATGLVVRIEHPRGFVLFWLAVAVVALAASFVLVRRQALKDAEPFWSPPTRRVAQALLPGFFFGFVLGVVVLLPGDGPTGPGVPSAAGLCWLPLVWIALYGCALHAAGFFMPRGMKLFGAAFVLGSSAFCLSALPAWIGPARFGHGVMGLFFGVGHLAYGVYLYFSEHRGNET